jgi:aconitate hydratase
MGVLPLQFPEGESIESLGLTGEEEISLAELDVAESTSLAVTATRDGGDPIEFEAQVRLDTANERQYFRHGGILHRVLRELR